MCLPLKQRTVVSRLSFVVCVSCSFLAADAVRCRSTQAMATDPAGATAAAGVTVAGGVTVVDGAADTAAAGDTVAEDGDPGGAFARLACLWDRFLNLLVWNGSLDSGDFLLARVCEEPPALSTKEKRC